RPLDEVSTSRRGANRYRRDEEGRLHPEEPAASAVRELFRRRAAGASWAELARFLEGAKVYPSTGNKHWSLYGVSSVVRNPVYLGQARSGKPLVTRAEFDAAQRVSKSLLKQRDGSVASQAVLGGLARCAGCGHTLKITGNTKRSTCERYPV